MKKLLLRFLQSPPIAKHAVIWALTMHNLAYKVVSALSPYIEPDQIHPKHRLIKYHEWFIQHLQPDWRVLDVGCGNGALTYDLKEHCTSVTAIDLNLKNIKRAKTQFEREGITYICGDATQYVFDQTFDAIVLSNVLEHIEDRPEFLKHLYATQDRANPPVLLLRVPMLNRDWITLYKKELGVEWRLDDPTALNILWNSCTMNSRKLG
jgi:SAM-dependent methyltransferase